MRRRRGVIPTLLACLAFINMGCGAEHAPGVEENRALVLRGIESLDAQDWAVYGQVWADDAVAHGPDGATIAGGAEIVAYERAFAVALPDIRRTVDDLLAEADRVVARVTVRGTYRAPLPGMTAPARGQPIEMGAIIIYRVADGQIVESWAEWNLARLVQQLEAEGAP